MAYSQADLDSLDRAIISQELEVQFGERKVRYRSLDELMRARAHVALQLAASSAPCRGATRRPVFATSRGE